MILADCRQLRFVSQMKTETAKGEATAIPLRRKIMLEMQRRASYTFVALG
jgi:hypothetical protein